MPHMRAVSPAALRAAPWLRAPSSRAGPAPGKGNAARQRLKARLSAPGRRTHRRTLSARVMGHVARFSGQRQGNNARASWGRPWD